MPIKITWRKWSAFGWIVLSSCLPAMYLYYFQMVSPLVIALSYLTLFSLNAFKYWTDFKLQYPGFRAQCRKLNLKSAAEKEIDLLVGTVANQANIIKPKIFIILSNQKDPNLMMTSLGWPFANALYISADFLQLYNNGLSKTSLRALLAHEMTHLVNYDSLITFLATLFLDLILLCLLLATVMALFLLIAPTGVLMLGAIALSHQFAFALLGRARETLADISSACFIHQPQAMIRALYEGYLHYLYWGRLVIENKFAQKKSFPISAIKSKQQLKKLHQLLSDKNYHDIYQSCKQLEGDMQMNSPMGSLFRHTPQLLYSQLGAMKEYSLTWLNTHPTLKQRELDLQQIGRCV